MPELPVPELPEKDLPVPELPEKDPLPEQPELPEKDPLPRWNNGAAPPNLHQNDYKQTVGWFKNTSKAYYVNHQFETIRKNQIDTECVQLPPRKSRPLRKSHPAEDKPTSGDSA